MGTCPLLRATVTGKCPDGLFLPEIVRAIAHGPYLAGPQASISASHTWSAASLEHGRPSKCTPITVLCNLLNSFKNSSWHSGNPILVASISSPVVDAAFHPYLPPSVTITTSASLANFNAFSKCEVSLPVYGYP